MSRRQPLIDLLQLADKLYSITFPSSTPRHNTDMHFICMLQVIYQKDINMFYAANFILFYDLFMSDF